jgi:hypothetical protein
VLEDEFPEVHRFVTSIYPSAEDDVITSPYNSILAMKELNEHADCVLPIDNQVRNDIGTYREVTFNTVLCLLVYTKHSLHFVVFSIYEEKISLNCFSFSSVSPSKYSPLFLKAFSPNVFLSKVFI